MLQEKNDIIQIWPDIKRIFSVAHSKAEYDRQVSFLDSILDEIGEDEEYPLASLVETIGSLVETYETAHLPEHEGSNSKFGILSCYRDFELFKHKAH